jgi:hypothetical protein
MTTLVSTAISAAVAALQRAPAVCPQVDRVRLRPVAKSAGLAVVVRPIQAEAGQAVLPTGHPTSWTTSLAVELYARSAASVTPDVAVDGLLEAAYTRLMEDNTLGGAVVALLPQGVSYDFDADGEQTACVTLVFHVRHRAGATFS